MEMSETKTIKSCDVCGKTGDRVHFNKEFNMSLCNNHYNRFKKYGKTLCRTIRDENEIIVGEDYAEIVLYDKTCIEKYKALIDLDDVDNVKKYKWCVGKNGDVMRQQNGKIISLNRVIVDCQNHLCVQHISGNKLDNRKSNLRICTRSNCGMRMNKGENKGITFDKKSGKFKAQIMVNYKNIHLGYFDSKVDAKNARKLAEAKYFGEFADISVLEVKK